MGKQNKGFAGMNDEQQKDISRQGGEESSKKQDMGELGKKGGQATHESSNAKEFTSEDASEIGEEISGGK